MHRLILLPVLATLAFLPTQGIGLVIGETGLFLKLHPLRKRPDSSIPMEKTCGPCFLYQRLHLRLNERDARFPGGPPKV